jgi:formate hydrogenlyase transcriptional activator
VRRERAMVRVNSASLSVASVEGELYGREQGAYVGSESRHVGLLELANGSTVFSITGRNGAAARLGLTPRVLEAKLAKLGIRRPRA